MRKALISGLTAVVLALGTAQASFANSYTDSFKISDWSADHIEILTDLGVIVGYPDGTFRPAANITREEMAVMLLEGMIALENSIYDAMWSNDQYLYEELVRQQQQILEIADRQMLLEEVASGRNWVGISVGATAIDDGDIVVNLDGKVSLLEVSGFYLSVNPFVSTAGEGGASLMLNKELSDSLTVSAGAGAAIGWEDDAALTSDAGDVEGFGQAQVELDLSDNTLVYVNGRVPFTGENSGDVVLTTGFGLKF